MTMKNISQVDTVIWRRIEDDIVVISEDGLTTHILNKTAAFVWELCDGINGSDEITTSLLERFDVSEEEAKADVIEIINKLSELGILKHDGETTGN